VAATLVDFGRRNQVTQIFLTRPGRKSWSSALSRDTAHKVIHLAKDMLIVIVSDREPVQQSV
jgi:K+-sensing histidine kinase KdpD